MLEQMQKALEETKQAKGKFLMKLDLQQHGADLPPNDPPADPPVDPPNDPPADPPAIKTFSQEDVNNIAAKEAKKATEKLLKQLGVTDFESAKDGLTKFKEMTEAQKTDAQKALDRAKELETTNGDLSNQVGTLTAQLAAMKAGVKSDSLDDVIVLAKNLVTEDVTIDDAIKNVLTKYPHFGSVQEETKDETKPPKFTGGEHKKDDKQTDAELWASAFKF